MMHACAGAAPPSQSSHSGMAIDDIPLDQRKYICTVIDFSIHQGSGYWDILVYELGFSERDSKNFLLAFPKGQSPTENLLRECSYRNYRVSTLSQVLKKVGLVKLAEEVLDDLGSKYNSFMPQVQPWAGPGTDKMLRHTTSGSDHSSTLSEGDKIGGLDTIHYSYEDIEKGTKNFASDMKLGAGAFGKVYKVKLKNTIFACKVLTINTESPHFSIINREQSDLRNELRYLAEYRHPNIIPLYGWSLDGKDPCLIYQYMKNGSLQDCLQRLTNNEPLTWLQRVRIACDAATGLQFLHTAKEKPLIHGDIKTANILLDDAFGAKLGDFGLAREGPRSHITGSYIKLNDEHTPGTMGYLAFEYMQSKKLSVQVDTYAFGVVLLELYTGRRAFYRTERNKAPTLLRDFMDEMANDCKGGPQVAEDRLYESQSKEIPSLPRELALRFVRLALECCHQKRNKRPNMSIVLKRLETLREEIDEVMSGSDKDTQNSGSSSGSNNTPSCFDQRNWGSFLSKTGDPHNGSIYGSRVPVESVDTSTLPQGDNKPHAPPPICSVFDNLIVGGARYGPYLPSITPSNPEGNPFQPLPNPYQQPPWLVNGVPQVPIPWNIPLNGHQRHPQAMPMQPPQMPFYHVSQFPDHNMAQVPYSMQYPNIPCSPKVPSHSNAEDASDAKSTYLATTPITPSTPGNFSTPDSFSSAEYYDGPIMSATPCKTQMCEQGVQYTTPMTNPFFASPNASNTPSSQPPCETNLPPNAPDSDPTGKIVKVNSVKEKLLECLSGVNDDTDVSEILESFCKT